MAVVSIIKSSELEGAHRLDAECYHPAKLKNLSIIDKLNGQKISDYFMNIRTIFNPEKQELINKTYIYGLTDTSAFLLGAGGEVHSSKEVGSTKKIVKKNDVIISRLRSYLKEIALILENGNTKLVSTEFIVLRSKDTRVSPELLFSYLQTDLVQTILQWSQEGTNHPRFSERLLLDIKIPNKVIALEENIKNLVYESYQLAKESQIKQDQAENILLEELGLKDFKPKYEKTYTANLSDAFTEHRIDAEYFQPAYETLVKKLRKYDSTSLLNLVQNVPARFNTKSESTKIFQYVELSNINSSLGTIDGYSEVAGDEAPSRAKRVLKANDVILSSVGGSLEKTALVDKEQEGYLASNGFFQFRSKNILPEVLLVLAKSLVLQIQFEKQIAGTILTAVPKEAIKKILVPRINKHVQEEIASLIQQSHEARKKSKQLLESTKKLVETAIEKDE